MECSVNGCRKPAHARKMCAMHIWRVKRHGDPSIANKRGWKFGTEKRSTLPATATPSLRDLSWVAGFVEGEGSFDKSGGTSRVSVSQVNREPIDRLLSLFGGAAKLYAPRKTAIHRSQPNHTWCWYASGSRARGIMMTLYVLMSAKRQGQIRKALSCD